MDTKYINYKIEENILYVGFGKETKKSLTVLDQVTLEELGKIVEEITRIQNDLKGVIFHSLIKGCFLAGADISLIDGLTEESEASEGAEKGQFLYNMIEDLTVPTICCVDGPCLGGGLELAMSCDTIICSDSPKTTLGLPEVKLGILPGF
ncbi:MAG: fatty acid oxidation complex subunit alpha FadJ, partial [Halobacteriovoraceae bacterium]|nr:fatty acid oxidation complex subunit alpha FadJ [Halobacteriovoraceae bacterium]